MRPKQANLLYEKRQYIFIDGKFYIAPKCNYQIIIIMLYNNKEDIFHTIV